MNDCERQAEDGCYLVISLLIEHERLERGDWSRSVSETLDRLRSARKSSCGSTDDWSNDRLVVDQAIQPMFDDIADLDRQVFLDEYLINPPGNETNSLTITIPAEIHWSTEGTACIARFPGPDHWKDVAVRSFFAKHSNGDLSYHVSLQLQYLRSPQHYFGLSALQKVLFPSEETDGNEIRLFVSVDTPAKAIELPHYIQTRFARDFSSTFQTHGPDVASDSCWSDNDLWDALIRDQRQPNSGDAWSPQFCRALFLLKDPNFHDVLTTREALIKNIEAPFARFMTCEKVNRIGSGSERPKPRMPTTRVTWDFKRDLKADENSCDDLSFLSGFLQNVIDFPRQDESEFLDGTDPLYQDSYFLIFATQEATFEIVRKSRSLNSGASTLGTCPYIFLVHLTLLHDEALLRRYERMVERVVEQTEASVPYDSDIAIGWWKLPRLTNAFRRQRMQVFMDVEKYMHLNLFRYDTERAFYDRIAQSRGLRERENHWRDVLARLSETVEGLHEQARQASEARLNRIVFLLTLLSIYQVVYAVLGSKDELISADQHSGLVGLVTEWLRSNPEALIVQSILTLVAIASVFYLGIFFLGIWHGRRGLRKEMQLTIKKIASWFVW